MSTASSSFDSVRSLNGAGLQSDAPQQMPSSMRPPPLKQQPAATKAKSITPASTPLRDDFPAPSPRNVPSKSIPTSPEGPNGHAGHDRDALTPLILPKSPFISQTTSPPGAMAEAFGMNSGRGSLIRRLSLRRRTSTNNMRTRDQSSGPMRQRSSSRNVGDGSFDVSDFELECDDDASLNGSLHDGVRMQPRPPPRKLSRRGSDKDSPPMYVPLPSEGTVFTKVTRKKKKSMRFWLDEHAAKLSWSPHPNDAKKQVYVDDIREIRTDEAARHHVEEFEQPGAYIERWLTIVYDDPHVSKGRTFKLMHLLAPSERLRDQWTASLRFLMKTRADAMAAMASYDENMWLKQWTREMYKKNGQAPRGDKNETMDFATILRICNGFLIKKPDQSLRAEFDNADEEKTGSLDFREYVGFLRCLTERSDIRDVFDAFKSPVTARVEVEDFLKFLLQAQGVDTLTERASCIAMFERFAQKRSVLSESEPGDATLSGMPFESFRDFLMSLEANPALISTAPRPLDRPLNEYFISSSHNTYLTGRQVGGHSSPEAYVEALKNGCRCLEIDTKDGEDGRPVVTHVNSWTSAIAFSDCIKAINLYAFFATPYPLIISLEVHCGPEQQKVMADLMKEQFGDQLVLEPLHPGSTVLPSPEELKRRILIKVKVPRTTPFETPLLSVPPAAPVHRRQRSASAPDPRGSLIIPTLADVERRSPRLMVSPTIPPDSSVERSPETPATAGPPSVPFTSSDDSDFDPVVWNSTKRNKSKTSNIVRVLGDMGVYTRGISFSDWMSPDSRTYNHIYSFNETTFENKCKTPEGKRLLERHNARCLMRVYPKGSRVYSSNFDPLQFWRRGVQMAATNWQTHDLGTQINNAMFAAGMDRTGYVLKPEELRRFRDEYALEGRLKMPKKLVRFSVNILSAQWLQASPDMRVGTEMNPYVEFEMYSAEDKAKGIATGEGGRDASARNGVSGIGSPLRKRTRIVERNGYNPQFNESITMTLQTKYPSLVFVRWTVWHSPDGRSLGKEPIASFTAKLSSLHQGYRHLELVDKLGHPLLSKLFCRIHKEDHRDVKPKPVNGDAGLDFPRLSEDSGRSSKDILRRVFNRTPSDRNSSFSRTSSMEKP